MGLDVPFFWLSLVSCYFFQHSLYILHILHVLHILYTYISVAEYLFTIGVEWLYSNLCTHYYYQDVTILMYIYILLMVIFQFLWQINIGVQLLKYNNEQ